MKLSTIHASRDEIPELSLTSMIDVVFLLLIFFVTTASFVRTEREMHSAIKFQSADGQKVNSDLERAVVVVEAEADGESARYRVASKTFSRPQELQKFLTSHFRAAPEGVYVVVERGIEFQWVAAALDACERADLGRVSYVPR